MQLGKHQENVQIVCGVLPDRRVNKPQLTDACQPLKGLGIDQATHPGRERDVDFLRNPDLVSPRVKSPNLRDVQQSCHGRSDYLADG